MSLKRFFTEICQYIRPKGRILWLVLIILLLEVSFNAAISFSLKYVIDDAVVQVDASLLVRLILLLLGLGLAVAVLGIWRDWLYSGFLSEVVSDIRCTLLQRLQARSVTYFMHSRVGDLMARFSGDMQALEQFLGTVIAWAIIPLLDIFTHVGLLFFLDWRLALLVVLCSPIIVLGPRVLTPKATQASIASRQAEGLVLASLQETLSGQSFIRAINAEKFAFDHFDSKNRALTARVRRMSFLGALVERSASIGALLMHVLMLGVGSYLIIQGGLSIGEFAAFNALFVTLSYSIMYVAQYSSTLVQAAGSMTRICELLYEPMPSEISSQPAVLGRLQYEIQFKDVSFGYEKDQLALKCLNLSFKKGQRVALVGSSGSGKSTLIKLLLRLFEPHKGQILYDGQAIDRFSMASLRQRVGVVFQETILFNISLRENIRFGYSLATDIAVEEAAKNAEIHDFILSLPEGYETHAGENGGQLSGGQRQRIGLARALLRSPDVLILDEATAALDPVTEAAIYATLNKLTQAATLINVTHRVHTITDYDLILVMDRGELREYGLHSELLANKGLYSELLNRPDE